MPVSSASSDEHASEGNGLRACWPGLQEIRMLERISHDKNIVQFYGACLETNPPMLVMEYMGVRATLTPSLP